MNNALCKEPDAGKPHVRFWEGLASQGVSLLDPLRKAPLRQEALRRILEAVFEPHFYDEMMGFRPNRGCHMAIRKLDGMITHNLQWWFKEVIQPRLRGYAGLVVYADDFVACFQYKSDAEWFYERLN